MKSLIRLRGGNAQETAVRQRSGAADEQNILPRRDRLERLLDAAAHVSGIPAEGPDEEVLVQHHGADLVQRFGQVERLFQELGVGIHHLAADRGRLFPQRLEEADLVAVLLKDRREPDRDHGLARVPDG